MAIVDGWFDFAERHPGPPAKLHPEENAGRGYVPHSAVGWYAGWLARLFSDARDGVGRFTPYAAASVHGFILTSGHVIQHYPVSASCWACGSRAANTRFVSFENEGGFDPVDEPLTEGQVAANVRIIRELGGTYDWRPSRPRDARDAGATLYEHRECSRFGAAATACPSNRIPWEEIMRRLQTDAGSRIYSSDEIDAKIGVLVMAAADHNRRIEDLKRDVQNVLAHAISLQSRIEALERERD